MSSDIVTKFCKIYWFKKIYLDVVSLSRVFCIVMQQIFYVTSFENLWKDLHAHFAIKPMCITSNSVEKGKKKKALDSMEFQFSRRMYGYV